MPTPEQGWLHTSEDGPLDLTLDRCCVAARTDTDETAEDEIPVKEDEAC